MNNISIKQVDCVKQCIACDKMLEELIAYESIFDNQINIKHKVEAFYERTLNKADCIIFLAYIKNNPVGYIMAYKQKENNAFVGNFITIMALFVKENYRHLGIGASLINSVENWAKDKFGNCFIELDCFVDNKTAIEFYNKLNYKPIRIKLRKKI